MANLRHRQGIHLHGQDGSQEVQVPILDERSIQLRKRVDALNLKVQGKRHGVPELDRLRFPNGCLERYKVDAVAGDEGGVEGGFPDCHINGDAAPAVT